MLVVRRIGALVLAAAAVIVWFTMTPGSGVYWKTYGFVDQLLPTGDDTYDLLRQIAADVKDTSDHTLNLYPQAQAAVEEGERTSALIGLGVLGIALMAFTTERRRDESTGAQQPYPPQSAQHPPVIRD